MKSQNIRPAMTLALLLFSLFVPACVKRQIPQRQKLIVPSDIREKRDLGGLSPVEFIHLLRKRETPAYFVEKPIADWITQKDLPDLLALLNNNESCSAVFDTGTNFFNGGQSTVSKEVISMIVGLKHGKYPPWLSASRPRDSQEEIDNILQWAKNEAARQRGAGRD